MLRRFSRVAIARFAWRDPVLVLAVLVLAIAAVSCSRDTAPTLEPLPTDTLVPTSAGPVTGALASPGAHVWLGIPYAAPPVGDLRWRAPRPPQPWKAPREAIVHGSACPQTGSPLGGAPADTYGELWGDEDCLSINVYAPADAPRGGDAAGLPVLVWIHGGGNVVGHSGFYNGARLAAEQQLIVVTFNYRLGPLGWFYHRALGDGTAQDGSGNYGVLDMIAALHWVRAEIDAFGGDPQRVTVAGQSAGGRNVFSLLVSPLAEGLFHRAIAQSGGTTTASVAAASHYRDDAQAPGNDTSSAEIVLKSLGGEREAAKRRAEEELADGEIASRLRALEVARLFELYEASPYSLGAQGPTLIRDGHVLPLTPTLQLLREGKWQQMPVMLGSTRDEAKLFMAFEPDQVQQVAGLPLWRKDAVSYEREAFYRSRAWKFFGVDRPVSAMLEGGASGPFFTYRWDWDEEGKFGFVDLSAIAGAGHGLEVAFIFGHYDVGPNTKMLYHKRNEAGRRELSRLMMGYWAAFVRDGAPGSGGTGAPVWPAITDEPDAEGLMVLDTSSDGGVRAVSERITKVDYLDALRADAYLEDRQRCRLYDITLGFDAAHAADRASLGCQGVPRVPIFGGNE
ncbi:MAG: carboxylesterase family protein [Pseudomonadota bacterium]